MTQLSNTTLATLQTTYFDDFNAEKQYYRILFRPSVAVQARELTQLQTLLQNQIQRHADYNFKDGSIVDGCHITEHPYIPYVRLVDTFTTNTSLSVEEFTNRHLITNGTNGNTAVKAYIKVAVRGYEANYPYTNRWYLDYIQTGKDISNNDIAEFQPGDTLYVYDPLQDKAAALNPSYLIDTIDMLPEVANVVSRGMGCGLSITDGIIYQKGFFLNANAQTIIIRPFDIYPRNYVVGFDTIESIVTENQDGTLNDNANGSTNFNAPGAHRLKLTPTLVAKSKLDVANNTNFFAIAEYENTDRITEKKEPSATARSLELMARRTFDESGDYVVVPFQVESRAVMNGLGQTSTAESDYFQYVLSTGVAYVKGYAIEKVSPVITNLVSRAITTEIDQNQAITANYGNYVIVDEVMGTFDTETLDEVALYNTAQNSITEVENASSAAAGSVIGYANVRGFKHSSGTRGTPAAQYYLYLFNIRMNSGQSFSDVRSIVATSGAGNCRADIVLQGGIAVLQDSKKNLLVFDTGKSALKSLTVGNAVASDTSFIYRQIGYNTLATTGLVTFNLETAAPGGSEELLISPGTYTSSTILSQFHITANSACYSANLAGTITVTSGNATITGSSTTFTTSFVAGDMIRVGTGTALFSIASIANNTQLTLNQTPSNTYTSNTYNQYFPEGHVFKLAGVTVAGGGTSFTANIGLTINTSTVVNSSYPVIKTQAVPMNKDVKKGTYVKIDIGTHSAGNTGPWSLGHPDVYNVTNIYVGTTYDTTNPDRLDWFTLDTGQRDDQYEHAKIAVKPQYKSQITNTTKLLVKFNHFVANTTPGVGFFSIDSYPIDDANTANTTGITTAEIPIYRSTLGVYDLRNSIDFRPHKANTANVSTSVANASINPANSSSNTYVTSTSRYMVEPDSTFTADLEYYLPRYDIIVMNKEGDVIVKQGVPSVKPRVPFADNDVMIIAESYVPPYPSLTIREGETYNRKDLANRITIKTTKRYTMADIRKIDDRLKRVEYYVVLNALEQQAKDMNIPSAADPTLDRFKNGIFADPFNSHNNGNVTDFEYNIAIDPRNSVARPLFKTHAVDFKYSNATSVTLRTGDIITMPYMHGYYAQQTFATKYRNTAENNWSWVGNLELYPSYDHFRDESQAAPINVNIDLAAPWQDFANSPYGTHYGDWDTVNVQTTLGSSKTDSSVITNDNVTLTAYNTTDTYVTTTTQQRTVTNINVDATTEKYSLGNYVADFSIQPYMRSRLVAFVCRNLKPNTRMYAFFDDVPVSAHCAPGSLSGSTTYPEGRENQIVSQTGAFGDPLVTDLNGNLYGVFKIPAQTFRTGERTFRIINVDNLVVGGDAAISMGSARYTASSLSVIKQGATLTTRTPEISYASSRDRQTIVTSDTDTSTRFNLEVEPKPPEIIIVENVIRTVEYVDRVVVETQVQKEYVYVNNEVIVYTPQYYLPASSGTEGHMTQGPNPDWGSGGFETGGFNGGLDGNGGTWW